MYLEGSDQHRGWFQSSLLVGLGTRGRAAVPRGRSRTASSSTRTAGRCRSRSATRSSRRTSSRRAAPRSSGCGSSMSDYREEMRVGKEILARVVEAYRKIRNTLRYLLRTCTTSIRRVDRVAARRDARGGRSLHLARYAEIARDVLDAYDEYDFPTIFQALNHVRDGRSERVLRRRLEGPALHVRGGSPRAPLGADGDVRDGRRPGAAAGADPAVHRRRAVAAPARASARRRCTWRSSRQQPRSRRCSTPTLADRWDALMSVRDRSTWRSRQARRTR